MRLQTKETSEERETATINSWKERRSMSKCKVQEGQIQKIE